jgi:hypothetical protein
MGDDKHHFDWLVKAAGAEFETHSKKIEELLARAQDKFAKDHTAMCGGVGIVMILASFALSFIGRELAFSLTGLVLGTIVLCIALALRHRVAEKQIQYSRILMNLEKERARFAQKQAVLSHIWLYGLPDGTPLAQLQILLGDTPTVPIDENWKQLPKRLKAPDADQPHPADTEDDESEA